MGMRHDKTDAKAIQSPALHEGLRWWLRATLSKCQSPVGLVLSSSSRVTEQAHALPPPGLRSGVCHSVRPSRFTHTMSGN